MAKSCIIEKGRLTITRQGLEAYLAGDYISTMDLFISQFEQAIKNLVEMNGVNVMTQKGDVFNLKTLDHLLNDQIVSDVFGEDKVMYFRALFTDKRGWNIRNNIAHGMMETEQLQNKA